tara:strand:+ start:1646 stop:2074 length:429 start_codon:yes stop_codon:yes gene_type:complete
MVKKSISQILIICFLISCSPQKRLNRLVRKYPQLTQLDTIRIIDTIVIDNFNYDTIETVNYHDTTIIVNNERIEARYFYDTLRQEIYHEITCKSDTIIQNRFIPIEKVIVQEQKTWQKYKPMAIFSIVILIALAILKRIGIV